MHDPLLEVENIYASYGKFDVLQGVSLRLYRGEIVCIIGPNGAGKSTVLNAIFGFLHAHRGRITFAGEDITDLSPLEVLGRGVAIVFQQDSVFPGMTVEENLEMGAFTRRDREAVSREIEALYELFPILGERRRELAGRLSGGQRQMLEMARVLLLHPKLLLLDEPTLGLAPAVIKLIYEKIHELNAKGLTILIVEQNARTALANSHRAYVLENGRTMYEGTGQEILDHPEVKRAYLGGFSRGALPAHRRRLRQEKGVGDEPTKP
ncbi:MAG: ABC transporter ATP-binding protein [Nitrospinota bacterium]